MSCDSETVEDTVKVEVIDDSCTLEYIEIVPLERPSDDYHTSEFIQPIFQVSPEELHEMKQEPADENDNGYTNYYVKEEESDTEDPLFPVQVSSVCTCLTDFCNSRLNIWLCLTVTVNVMQIKYCTPFSFWLKYIHITV